jgi:type I restriction enzyme S subunit
MNKEKTIYKLPEGWSFSTIDGIIDYSTGIFKDGDWIESKDQDLTGEVRLIQLADVGDGNFRNRSNRFMNSEKAYELNCTYLQKGDLLIARMPEPLGRACIFPYNEKNKFVSVVDVAIIRTGKLGADSKLLMYFINSPIIRKEISELQTGTTRKRISRRNLSTIKFPIPPFNEQKRIVSKMELLFSELDQLDKGLQKAKQQLEVYRQAILKHAFEGKLTEQWRKENNPEPAEKLLEYIKEERKNRHEQELLNWHDSIGQWEKEGKISKKPTKPRFNEIAFEDNIVNPILDDIPNIWMNCKLGEVFDVYVGATPSRKNHEYWDNGKINWVSSGEVFFNKIINTKEKITQLGLENASTTIHPAGTVLMGMIGEGKTRGQAAILKIEACHNQNTAAIRVSDIGFIPDFLFYYLELNYERNRDLGSGISQKALNKRIVQHFNYPLCSINEQIEIIKILDSYISNIENLKVTIDTSLKKSESLRQSLLKKAFDGELVEQDSNEEPASELLKRIKEKKEKYLTEQKELKKKSPKKTKKMSKNLSIEEVLKTSDKPMLAEYVWQQSKYKNNIEEFYAELKKIQEKVKEVKKGTESLLSLAK